MARPCEPRPPRWDAMRLHSADDVATALRDLAPGEVAQIRTDAGSETITVREAVPLCHKLALRDLAVGAPVRKYGEVIGRTTMAVEAGGWVHVHNLESLRARREPVPRPRPGHPDISG